MIFLYIVLVAGAGAVLSTLPIGPINLLLLSLARKSSVKLWWALAAGVIAVDAGMALGMFHLVKNVGIPWLLTGTFAANAQLFAGFAFCVIGFVIAFKPARGQEEMPEAFGATRYQLTGMFLFGAVATFLEPALPVFWGAWWLEYEFPKQLTLYSAIPLIAIGVGGGDLLIFYGYRRAGAKLIGIFQSEKAIKVYQRCIGAVFVLIGIATILKSWREI